MKTNKLLKRALKHPELFTEAELSYFRLVRRKRKEEKKAKAKAKKPESDFLL
mgnify:CR=1|tara:strand:+ start:747 stop:902 length:156 start_codon:yes stop_codon:yes gene_type:complete